MSQLLSAAYRAKPEKKDALRERLQALAERHPESIDDLAVILRSAVWPNKAPPSTAWGWLCQAVGTDATRPAWMRQVWCDGAWAWATNGHWVARIADDRPRGLYDPRTGVVTGEPEQIQTDAERAYQRVWVPVARCGDPMLLSDLLAGTVGSDGKAAWYQIGAHRCDADYVQKIAGKKPAPTALVYRDVPSAGPCRLFELGEFPGQAALLACLKG